LDIPRPKRRRFPPAVIAGAVVTGLLLTTLGLSRLRPAAPEVEGSTLLIDTVKRGLLIREVHGSGTLVPENQRFVSAVTAGRVERVQMRAGATVESTTVLVELSNPDVQLEALDAERQLKLAEAELASIRSTLESAKLAQEGALASSRTALREAERAVSIAERLSKDGLNSQMDVDRARDQLTEAQERHVAETRRMDVANEAFIAQIDLRKADVERLKAIAHFQRERVASMQVRAGAAGVVQELSLEPGQWVQSGQRLARVASPGRLKAVLLIPETQARDVGIGLPAIVDTRDGTVKGHVSRIDPGAVNGTVTVDITMDGALPRGARPDLSVDGTIEIDRLKDVVSVGRPASGASETDAHLFRLAPDGHSATRVTVKLGRASFNAVEIVSGLQPGDRVILSDMDRYDEKDRVRIR
jgi:multidrug efflux pump subunit AcrA (membrane-fusion protein)